MSTKNDRTEAHKALIHIMNSPGVSEKTQAAAVKAVGELELQYAKLKLARFKAKQAREKEKSVRKGFGVLD
jgi:hypothetical protein